MAVLYAQVLAAHRRFPRKWRSNGAALLRVCLNCKETKRCYTCRQLKEEADFSAAAWRRRDLCRQTCKTCSRKERGCWTRASCATSRLRRYFGRHSRPARRSHVRRMLSGARLETNCPQKSRATGENTAKRKQRILAEVWRLVGEMRGTPAGSGSNCSKETEIRDRRLQEQEREPPKAWPRRPLEVQPAGNSSKPPTGGKKSQSVKIIEGSAAACAALAQLGEAHTSLRAAVFCWDRCRPASALTALWRR